MKEKTPAEEEQLKKWLKELGHEKPSFDFSNNVMEKIYALESQKQTATAYKPVISRKVWLVMGVITFVYTLYLYFFTPNSEGESLINVPDFSLKPLVLQTPDLSQFITSQLLVFAVAILVLMVIDRLFRKVYV